MDCVRRRRTNWQPYLRDASRRRSGGIGHRWLLSGSVARLVTRWTTSAVLGATQPRCSTGEQCRLVRRGGAGRIARSDKRAAGAPPGRIPGVSGTAVAGCLGSVGSRVLFHGIVGDSSNMWQVAISREGWRVNGQAQRATFGTTDEASASVTSDGRMVFISRTMGADIWNLPIDANRGTVGGPLKRVTQDAADDYNPTVSDDGATLVFRSRRAGRFGVVLKSLGTGSETVITRVPEDHYPAVSHDGTKVAYSYRQNGKMPIFIVAASGGSPAQVCDDCGEVEAWSAGGDQILYLAAGEPSGVGLLTLGSSPNQAWLKNPGYGIYHPRLSSDSNWIVFNARRNRRAPAQVIVAKAQRSDVGGEKDWIVISQDGDAPNWSPDGNLVYFWSDRDGSPVPVGATSRSGDETTGRATARHSTLPHQRAFVEEPVPRPGGSRRRPRQGCLQPGRA